MITDTTAIVLKTVPFSESSLIVTVLSEKHGKMAVMARGARRKKSRFGGLLQPGAVLEVSYYHKSTRDVQNLSDAVQKLPTWRIQQQMEKMAIGLATLELSEQICHQYEPMPELLAFLEDFLSWLHVTKANPRFLFPYIQLRVAQIAGIGVSIQLPDIPQERQDPTCVADKKPYEPQSPFLCYFNIESGNIARQADKGLCFGVTDAQADYLRYITEGRKGKLVQADFSIPEIKNLIHHLDAYFQFHLEGFRSRKSDAIFEQIL